MLLQLEILHRMHAFSRLRNINLSTCNLTKKFVIGLISAKLSATGFTSHCFLLSHYFLTKGTVLDSTKWTFFVPILVCYSSESKDFHKDGSEDF